MINGGVLCSITVRGNHRAHMVQATKETIGWSWHNTTEVNCPCCESKKPRRRHGHALYIPEKLPHHVQSTVTDERRNDDSSSKLVTRLLEPLRLSGAASTYSMNRASLDTVHHAPVQATVGVVTYMQCHGCESIHKRRIDDFRRVSPPKVN